MFEGDPGWESVTTAEKDAGRHDNPIANSFEVMLASTPGLRAKAHRLRYEVYCVEHSYEDPADHPGGLEYDSFDRHSVQSVLIHRTTGIVAGVARLILPWHDGEPRTLPFHDACAHKPPEHQYPFPISSTGEASRLLISREFVRYCDRLARTRGPAARNGRAKCGNGLVFQNLLFGLIASITQMSFEHDITHVCGLLRPALLRLLNRTGNYFVPVGPMVDHHGRRQPCYVDLEEVSKTVARERPDIWEIMFVPGQLWQSSFETQIA